MKNIQAAWNSRDTNGMVRMEDFMTFTYMLFS